MNADAASDAAASDAAASDAAASDAAASDAAASDAAASDAAASGRPPERLLVVDDHAVVRRGLREMLDDQTGLAVVSEAATPAEALDRAAEHAPDLALVDITLKGSGEAAGLDLIKRLRALEPRPPRVLAVSMHDETLYARRALAAGAQGYIMKRASDDELVRAVRRVLDGRCYVSEPVGERLAARPREPAGEATAPVEALSDRELEVFLLVGRGLAPRHIAERLHLSVKTVETHRRNIRQKLGLEGSAELVRYAIAWSKERGPQHAAPGGDRAAGDDASGDRGGDPGGDPA